MPFWESSIFWGIAGIAVSVAVSTFFFVYGKCRKKSLEVRIIPTLMNCGVRKHVTNIKFL